MTDSGDPSCINFSGKLRIGRQLINDPAQITRSFPQLCGLIRVLIEGRCPWVIRCGHDITPLDKLIS